MLFSSIHVYIFSVLTLISLLSYLSFRSLGCIHTLSPSFLSFIFSELLSHLQASLSRSRIVNSHTISVFRRRFSAFLRSDAQVLLLCIMHLMYAFLSRARNVYRGSIVWLAISARVPTLHGDDCFIRCTGLTDGTGYTPSVLVSTE